MSLYAGLWCNGNTQDFGPWIMGSTPVSPTTDNDYVKQIGCATRSLLKTLESFFMKLNWGSKLPWLRWFESNHNHISDIFNDMIFDLIFDIITKNNLENFYKYFLEIWNLENIFYIIFVKWI